ncbi:helix-turn-helix domain-containing protein [Nocardia zapadnayensis]|uniref:helix-turn-helix domain-containing protein n=1 Tax=Nocardia rhamnosiphila TaxID=426716 RepID=UPI0022462D8B|nr:helix-turn-helix domain-containing protein [Nocardia zapadnayensis]MCX0275093.1 helix-turn-helix domain-containing protein [Nocardia zapadnayensis]
MARLAKAREALEPTNESVTEIPRSVGYVDVSNFRRLFHRAMGATPSEYRNRFGIAGTSRSAGCTGGRSVGEDPARHSRSNHSLIIAWLHVSGRGAAVACRRRGGFSIVETPLCALPAIADRPRRITSYL